MFAPARMRLLELRSVLAESFPALGSADYRRLFFAALFQNAGNWALMLGRGWLVFELTGSSAAVGLVVFAAMAPFIVVAPVAGVLADRYDRRDVALLAAIASVASSALLAAVTLAGLVAPWHVVVLAFAHGSARAVQVPAEHALIPNVVPARHLVNAIALSSVSTHGARLLGPLIGAGLLATLGAGSVFVLGSVLIAGAVWQLALVRERRVPQPDDSRSVAQVPRELAAGVRYVFTEPRLRLVIVLVVLHCSLTMAFDSMLPRLATLVDGGESTYGALLMGLGGGAVAGTLAVSLVRGDVQGIGFALSGAGSGLAMLLLALADTALWAVVGAVVAGAAQAAFMALAAALLQTATADRWRARVTSLYVMLAIGHMSFLNLAFGAWADSVGVRVLLIGPALAWLVLFALAALLLVDLRYLLRRGTLPAPPSLAGAAEAPLP